MRTTILAVLIAMSALCASTMAQEGTVKELLIVGHELYESGSYKQAAGVYDRVIQMDPSNADAWFGKGNAVKVLYKNPEDTNLYEYIGRDLQYADVWAARGYVFATTARLEEAVEAYEKALQLYDERLNENSSDIDAWLNKGRALDMSAVIYNMLGNNEKKVNASEKAYQAYDKAIEIDPNNSEVWAAKGRSLTGYEALEAYDKAIELNPKNEDAWLGRANALDYLAYITNNESFYNDSIEAIDRALEINPLDSRTWYAKGHHLMVIGKCIEATEAYEKSLELTPQDKLRWFAIEILYTYDNVLGSDTGRYSNRYAEIAERANI